MKRKLIIPILVIMLVSISCNLSKEKLSSEEPVEPTRETVVQEPVDQPEPAEPVEPAAPVSEGSAATTIDEVQPAWMCTRRVFPS